MIFLALSLLPLHARSLCAARGAVVVGGAAAPKIVLMSVRVRPSIRRRDLALRERTRHTAGAEMDDETKASHKDDGDFSGCASNA